MAVEKDPSMPAAPKQGAAGAGGLGTFAGVFTPSILTILGIILFLRLGYVTGCAGLGRALIIIAIANLISILTSQSLAAIATNLKVKGGGDYYLISRTLGYPFGGAIGIVLYLAQSVSVAFYCIGFAEATTTTLSLPPFFDGRTVAVMAVGLLLILAWLGADWATRFQYGVMVLLGAALLSFYAGGLVKWQAATFAANWTAPADAPPFWVIFGIFFPAVTGFTQGVSMSGDLKDSSKSLPLGTFLAVGLSILIYFSMALIFAGVLPNRIMMADYQSIKQVARFEGLIDAGVIAATLSSAMASFLGGPRILQSLSADRIFPWLAPFAKGAGPLHNPRRAVLLTGAIALATIALGQLNLVAQVVTMFFLISYGLLNYATYYEARAASPSFRPRFRWFNKYLSLAGFLVCLGVILALDIQNGVIAMAILIAIHQYLKHTAAPSRWADSSGAYAFQVIRQQLLSLAHQPEHHRNWRPHILAFTHDSDRRIPLLTFAQWIEGGSGLITAVRMVEGPAGRSPKPLLEIEDELSRQIQNHDLNIFPLAIRVDDIESAAPLLLQSYGIGPLHANTVLINWFGQSGVGIHGLQALKYGANLQTSYRMGYNLVVLHFDPERWEMLLQTEPHRRRIDVWWRGDATSRLMLLFAYLTTRHEDWQKAEIRVLTAGTAQRLARAKEDLAQILEDVRIDARPQIVSSLMPDVVTAESADSAIVFLPFMLKQFKPTDINGLSLDRTLRLLPPTALVLAAEDIALDAEPEEGAAGELAAAMDALQAAEQLADKTEKDLLLARNNAEDLKNELKTAIAAGAANEARAALEKNLARAEQEAEKAFRKAGKAQAKAKDAALTVQRLGGPAPDPQKH
jgi:amino acid transporter